MAGGRPPRAQLANQLSTVAKQAADDRGLRLDTSAQDYLGQLVSTATDYFVEHPDASIDKAESSFTRLANELAGAQRARTAAEDTLLPQRGALLNAEDLHIAALGLCPGFFPFC